MSGVVTNILMLGGAKRVSLARQLKRAGRERGVEVRIFSSEIDTAVPIACEGTVIPGPRWRDNDAVERLSATIEHYAIGIVLPFVDGAIETASRLRERLGDVFIPVSDFDTARTMFDKAKAAKAFAECGIAIPQTYTVGDCRYPAIFKPREGSASKGIVVVRGEAEARDIANPERYLIQEYIARREEYTVDCYVSTVNGEVLCAVPRKRLSTSGGEVDRTQTCRIPALINESHKILTSFPFRGPITLQFIHDLDTDRYLLMEINPRLGGGVICSIRAGADIAGMLLDEAAGRQGAMANDWRDGALMARYFDEVMF